MNGIVTNFLLTEDESIPEMHLSQPEFNYSACRPFTKNKDRIEKFKKRKNSRHIYENEPDIVCSQHDMA